MKEEEDARIYNARNNKSIEDLRELIERVILQNIEIKKQKDLGAAQMIALKNALAKGGIKTKTVAPKKIAAGLLGS